MKKVLVFMLVISMLLVCSGFATATEAISFPNGRVVSNGIEKPTKEDVETQYVLAGMEISDIDFITGDYEMVTASSVRSVPVTEPCDKPGERNIQIAGCGRQTEPSKPQTTC